MSRAQYDINGTPLPTLFVPGTVQNVTFSGTSALSSAFAATTNVARFCATAACWVCFTSETATAANSTLLPANTEMVVGVRPGTKVAALQVSAGGTLNITEMA